MRRNYLRKHEAHDALHTWSHEERRWVDAKLLREKVRIPLELQEWVQEKWKSDRKNAHAHTRSSNDTCGKTNQWKKEIEQSAAADSKQTQLTM